MSRVWLAQLVSVDVTAISAWENDKYRPRVEKRLQLAQALGVSLDELFPEPDDTDRNGAAVVQIPNHANFLERLLEHAASAQRHMRAIHCSCAMATSSGVMAEFRASLSQRLLADTIAVEHIEVIRTLSRLKEVLHNIHRYDGHTYSFGAYYAAPDETIPGPNAFLFDDRDLLLGSSWNGEPIDDNVRLSLSGGELVDYFRQRWSEMWNGATPLNPEGANDLSNVEALAIRLGLPASDWPEFLQEARTLTLPDGGPPFV